ncbi:ferric reductase [Thalassotalea litorea]|uniref:Ferric reductase n=1 Tax=Thalassotalea litorea TaxID=2020715 RepID=A0A5R9ISG3_9GAMM|nr:ferric reductase-like transmembrane domain-containing protein [Thalassotalea litorea]TLU67569.1 ferric reductase [Thalassotalea litorea]
MTRNKTVFWIGLLLVIGLWISAEQILAAPYEFFRFRKSMIYLTGVVTIAAMAFGMVLALRPVFLSNYLGGLDKSYRLHKWLGITTLVFSLAHYLWIKAPHWLVDAGLMNRPEKVSKPVANSELEQLFRDWHGLAETLGEWSLYILVVLIVVALIKWFPYRLFFKMHRLLAILFLVLVFHSTVLMKFSYWQTPLAGLVGILMVLGIVSALFSLLRKIGERRTVIGVVEKAELHPDNKVLAVEVALKDRWPGHEAGQFAFVQFDSKEGHHPFTISSSWHDDGKLSFHIKGLGDYTRLLPKRVAKGDLVTIEGPYGQFNFKSSAARQVWIGAGIGITPFMARMAELEQHSDGKDIDLFYCTRSPDKEFIDKIQFLAAKANINLYIIDEHVDGLLSLEDILAQTGELDSADLWFCGPGGFAKSLQKSIQRQHIQLHGFHQELFQFR